MNRHHQQTLITLTLAFAAAGVLVWSPGMRSRAQEPNRQLVQSSAPATTANAKRIALVIGNGAYTSAPPLKNPPNDARDMAATLKALGFDVTSGINIGQKDMKRLIREFGQKLKAGGSGLFYYAGHGVQSKGRNYLIPVDAEIQSEADVEDSGVDVSLVLNYMDDAQNGLNIVILDACRNNPFSRSFRSASTGLAQVDAPTGTLIAYATAPGTVASDGPEQNGLYTSELLKQMRVPGQSVTDMFMRVRGEVMKQTGGKQVPWEASSLVGSFYFSPQLKNAVVTQTGAAASETKVDPAAAFELSYWETIKNSKDPEDFKAYLKKYPNGQFADLARNNLRRTMPQPGAVVRNQMGMELVWIPPGTFMMGSESQWLPQIGGKHQVTISEGFYMGRYEVTQSQWQAMMDNDKSRYKGANLPVQAVSWNDAQKFIDKMNQKGDGFHYRLPSEAEWEYACRAGTTTDYSFGDYSRGSPATAAQANFNGMHMGYQPDMAKANAERPTPVGSFAPNAFGLYDMHGNMWEWCEDRTHPNYEGAPTDGSAWLSGGEGRVMRGGSYDSDAISMFSAYRSGSTPDVDSHYYGLRVVAIARTQ